MAKKESRTDYWVAKLLDEENIPYTPQGSDNVEINETADVEHTTAKH